MSANFITGTGTDIGKTWLCTALLTHWRGQGKTPAVFKPVLSGFDPRSAESSDAGVLLNALGQHIDQQALDAIAPWRFAAPLSPDMAAAKEGRRIPFEELVGFSRRAARVSAGPTVIEGVGGVMVPLDDDHTVRDWIAASDLPAVVVTGSYLGSLSHTLTAVAALQQAKVRISAVVVNETPGSTVDLHACAASLVRHLPDLPVVAIERTAPQTGVAELAALLG